MKKHLLILVFFCQFLIVNAQENDLKDYKANVEFINSDIAGTVTVSAFGFGKKQPESIIHAARNAFFTVLFRGIPGSKYKSPLIENEEAFKNNPVVLEILKDGYVSFLSKTTVVNIIPTKKKDYGAKGILTKNNFTINYDALRRYLEQKKVIRKLGL